MEHPDGKMESRCTGMQKLTVVLGDQAGSGGSVKGTLVERL